jgi:hypothetical protein
MIKLCLYSKKCEYANKHMWCLYKYINSNDKEIFLIVLYFLDLYLPWLDFNKTRVTLISMLY